MYRLFSSQYAYERDTFDLLDPTQETAGDARFKADRRCYYLDANSLYPAVAKDGLYPTGPPLRIRGRHQIERSGLFLCREREAFMMRGGQVDGVALATVYVPYEREHELYGMPFLPLRTDKKDKDGGRRVFRASCFACFKSQSRVRQQPDPRCTHTTVEQRCWTAEYAMSELAYACSALPYQLLGKQVAAAAAGIRLMRNSCRDS